jgi:hypothetical protein
LRQSGERAPNRPRSLLVLPACSPVGPACSPSARGSGTRPRASAAHALAMDAPGLGAPRLDQHNRVQAGLGQAGDGPPVSGCTPWVRQAVHRSTEEQRRDGLHTCRDLPSGGDDDGCGGCSRLVPQHGQSVVHDRTSLSGLVEVPSRSSQHLAGPPCQSGIFRPTALMSVPACKPKRAVLRRPYCATIRPGWVAPGGRIVWESATPRAQATSRRRVRTVPSASGAATHTATDTMIGPV